MTDITSFNNRLKKNFKHQAKWAKRQGLEVWRLYDKDIPQFPFAIDIYGSYIHLQEFKTGWLMDADDYQIWLDEVVNTVSDITGVDINHIAIKERARQKGSLQYLPTGEEGNDFIVNENGRQFWVNLWKYLDTGLFIDHRNTRSRVGAMAKGKSFLNLFAYTGSFTVYAATGGARCSETVDLSNTYLDWAKKNFELNCIDTAKHKLIRDDVFNYLRLSYQNKKKFDLIVMDPPSFSNSKKMLDILDVQRDHSDLIKGAMKLLEPDGLLFFSNNLRTFKLDSSLEAIFEIIDISNQSIPEDYRNKKIHQCWEIRHK